MNALTKSRQLSFAQHKLDALAGSLIFIVALFVFLVSPVSQVTDSHYSMLVSQSLLEHGSFALDRYRIPRRAPFYYEYYVANGDIWQLEIVNEHLYYYFPPGTSILSAPFVAVMKLCGMSAVNVDGTYNLRGEVRMQSVLAAVLMALLCVIFFCTARLVLPLWWSVLIALAGAFGTQVWSTASRGMWSDTWGILLVGVVVWMVLAEAVGKHRLNAVGLASVLAWTYFVRPTNAVAIIGVSVYVLLYHRRIAWRYMVTGAVWLMLFVVYSWLHFGTLLPHYYLIHLRFNVFWTSLAGNLISPSRGLLVYAPVLLFVAYLLVRHWKHVGLRRLVALALFVIAGHLLMLGGFVHWWGGGSFGPRLTTGLVPWFVLLGIVGVNAMLVQRTANARVIMSQGYLNAPLVLGAALLLLSIFINARGALSPATWEWNTWVENGNRQPSRLWQWSYPQFLAGLVRPPLPEIFPPVQNATRIDFATHDADKFLWYGWSDPETQFRWTSAKQATMVFALDGVRDVTLEMRAAPFLAAGKLAAQHLNITINGQRVTTITLTEASAAEHSLALPRAALREKNVLEFEMPDASSPKSLNVSDDGRVLGISVEWLEIRPQPGDQP